MPPEKQKVTLIMQCDDLTALELWHRGEKGLKHTPDRMSEASDEVVENQFRVVWRGPRVPLKSQREKAEFRVGHEKLTKILLVNSTELSLKYAVGPFGRCTSVMASRKRLSVSY